ncbi:MAG: protein kinase [Planctomycetia bacterium]|nr:protein kinase [Planctomycetia bacterium]
MAHDNVPKQVGNYDLISKIAEGGMGAVYKAKHVTSGEIVAIKIIPPETAKNPVLLKRFEQEFRAASLFDHPNIVRAIEYCGTATSPFLVMEFVDGESLGQKVERYGAMDEAEAVRIIGQVCDGLHRAHKQGLVHRDVKPDNILLTRDGVAKLTDMGLVKDVEGELNLTKTGRGLGTPHFMAPEQFRNAKNADVRCDIYSLGATLYMMLTAIVPFAKTSPLDCWLKKTKNDFEAPNRLNPRVSERVNRAILRSMSADPQRRPASCREFIEDLTGQPWTARADGPAAANVATPAPLGPPPAPPTNDLWYMVYRDATGNSKTVKGSTARILENLKSGSLGDVNGILVCRTKAGPFLPIKNVAEFRIHIVEPASIAPNQVTTGRTPAAIPIPAPKPEPVARPDPVPFAKPPAPARASRLPTLERPAYDPAPVEAKSFFDNKWMPWIAVGLAIVSAIVGAILFAK